MSKLDGLKTTPTIDGPALLTGAEILGIALLEQHLPAGVLARLRTGTGLAIVQVPNPRYLSIVHDGLCSITPEAMDVTIAGGPEWHDRTAMEAMAKGHGSVYVCTNVERVPAAFRAFAGPHLIVGAQDSATIASAVKTLTGTAVRIPSTARIHVDPIAIAACLLRSVPAKKVLAAILALTDPPKTDESLPSMEECVEFGPARDWALRLKSDLAAWQRGEIPASDLDSSILLHSGPGYGKTTFAKILAHSIGAPLHSITMGRLFAGEGYLGDVLKAIRGAFNEAASSTPSVLLIDEIDAFPDRRVRDGNSSFMNSMVAELLSLLDGAAGKAPGLVIVGTTNLLDRIDPAIRRPGRLSTVVDLPLPGRAGVARILRQHLGDDLAGQSIDLVVDAAIGSTPAELMQLVRVARSRARTHRRPLSMGDLERQARVDQGPLPPAHHLQRLAAHEAGHAVAISVLKSDTIHEVSIRGGRGTHGHVLAMTHAPTMTLSDVIAEIMVALAGRAAEEVLLGSQDRGVGAGGEEGSDLHQATALAARLRGNLGAGSLLWRGDDEDVLHAVATDPVFRALVEADLKRYYQGTCELMTTHHEAVSSIVAALLQKGVVTGVEVSALLATSVGRDSPQAA